MRRAFRKGLECLHSLVSCSCEQEPVQMCLQTVNKPDGGFVLLCAAFTIHGREEMRKQFSYVNDAIENRVLRAVGYYQPKFAGERKVGAGLLHKATFSIYPDGRVADASNRIVGFIQRASGVRA